MLVELREPIIGIIKKENTKYPSMPNERYHANKGDRLKVLLVNRHEDKVNYYICDSKYYPRSEIVVFPSQCLVIHEKEKCELEIGEDDLFFEQEEDTLRENRDNY